MEGTRAVVFREPQGGEYVDHVVYCLQTDRSGNEAEFVGGLVGPLARTEYTFREDSLPRRPDSSWLLVDDQDRRLKIVDVYEKNSGPRARQLVASCERT